MSTGDFDEEILKNLPAASGVGVFFCSAPECNMPHVMLYDEDGDPMAHFAVPQLNPDGTGFLADLTDALMRAAAERTN